MAKISKERKVTYYIGMGMTILGFILFISIFFTFFGFMNRGIDNMYSVHTSVLEPSRGPSFARPLIGMILMIVGQLVMRVGARGAAGSGIILDPEQAREDLKPYTEAAGGMINDVISNIDAFDKKENTSATKEIVKVRCRSCGILNDEDAKYCKSCGKEV